MARDQRETITKAMISKVLCDTALHMLRAITLITLPFILLLFFFALIIEDLTMWLIVALFFLGFAVYLAFAILEYKRYRSASFRFVKDTLREIAEDERLVRRGRYHSLESAFYFDDHGRLVVSNSEIRLSTVGDEFLLVVSDNRANTVLAHYNMKYYRTEEWDE